MYRLLGTILVLAAACGARSGVRFDSEGGEDQRNPDGGVSTTVEAGLDASVWDAAAFDAGAVDAATVDSSVVDPDRIVQMVAAGSNTCVRRASGDLRCWGGNATGQLDFSGEIAADSTYVAVGGSDPYGASTAFGTICSIREGGEVWCWGNNYSGNLGLGTAGATSSPMPMIGVPLAERIFGGSHDTCLIDESSSLWCVGLYNTGQLQIEPTDFGGFGQALSIPRQLTSIGAIRKISLGTWHVCALVETGQILCWGDNLYGMLGAGYRGRHSLEPRVVAGIDDAVDVSTLVYHACAVARAGSVFCWGQNFGGQIGQGRTDGSVAGHPEPEEVLGIEGATNVAVGDSWSCALHQHGAVSCWGSHAQGAVGSATQSLDPTTIVPEGATAIAAGHNHACALFEDNSVQCWGQGAFGELGSMNNENSPVPVHALAADLAERD